MTEMKIMLVEDDTNLAELIRMYLISENWKSAFSYWKRGVRGI